MNMDDMVIVSVEGVKITDCQIRKVGPYWDWLGESTELQHRLMGERFSEGRLSAC